jgi:HSP20 family molecular chaperone IbpA
MLSSNVLTIAGQTSKLEEFPDPGATFRTSERCFGSLKRTISVPPQLKESEVRSIDLNFQTINLALTKSKLDQSLHGFRSLESLLA